MTGSSATPASWFPRLLQALDTAVVVLDSDQTVAYMNASAENLLGISLRRVTGQPLPGNVPGLEGLTDLCIRAHAEQRGFGQTLTLAALQHDGSERDLAVRVTPLIDGPAGQLIVELFDVTRRQQLDREHALVAQHGVSRRMLQQLAHEIRNPLGGLRGAAQLLERELPDPSLHEFTRVIISEADRLAGLVDGLLGPVTRPRFELINVHEVLERVAVLVSSEAPELQLQRDYDPSLPLLRLDRDQMTQAFLNLVRNAAQATQGVGRVLLRTRVRSNQSLNRLPSRMAAVIGVEDDGPGVPEDLAETIFYPLVTGRDDGTGIGLPLAQDLVSRHDGLIEFSSVPGCTVFEVHLPVPDTIRSNAAP